MRYSKTRFTSDHLPKTPTCPEHADDHTGRRRGTMTAIAWCRASRSGKGTVWICRCDCGLYEHRRPGTWNSRPFPEDTCERCQRDKGPNARQTAPERFTRWVEKLRCLGLSDAEIAGIQALGTGVETSGKTLDEIRQQMAQSLVTPNAPGSLDA